MNNNHYTTAKTDGLVTLVLFGSISGLCSSLVYIFSHHFFEYRMPRSILLAFRHHLVQHLAIALLAGIILYALWRWSLRRHILPAEGIPLWWFLLWHLTGLAGIALLLEGVFPGYSPADIGRMLLNRTSRLIRGFMSWEDFGRSILADLLPLFITSTTLLVIFFGWRRLLPRFRNLQAPAPVPAGRLIGRITAVLLLTITAGLSLIPLRTSSDDPADTPHIILIVVDTLRADYLSFYGHPRTMTPSLRTLSDDSLLFENALTPAPWTSPAVASLFTSQYPAVLGFHFNPPVLPPVFLTWAEIMRESGYRTGGIISHTFLSGSFGFDQGFDTWDEDCAGGHGYISSPGITRKAISFIRKNRNHPFFLFLHYFDPHFDYIGHPDYNYDPQYRGPVRSGMSIHELRRIRWDLTHRDLQQVRALYQSEISFTDHYIGLLLQALKDLGMYHQSVIIFTADHGEEFCERPVCWIGHTRTLYQEQLHVPLMIKPATSPGNGRRIRQRVGLWDILPTILSYRNLSLPEGYPVAGKHFDLFHTGPVTQRNLIAETERHANLETLIRGDWKLIVDYHREQRALYNLASDPGEKRNLQGQHPEVEDRLFRSLVEWQWNVREIRKHFHLRSDRSPELSKEQETHLRSLGYLE